MKNLLVWQLFLFSGLIILPWAGGQVLTVPPSLDPGDHYHLVFLTSTGHDAVSTDIEFYNGMVQLLADNAGLGTIHGQAVTWKVIGSTEAVSALENVGTVTSAVYRLDGRRVAADSASMFDSNIDALINMDELGNSNINAGVFTGTDISGAKFGGETLGAVSNVRRGDTKFGGAFWISAVPAAKTDILPFYAISSELIAPPINPPMLELVSITNNIFTLRWDSNADHEYRVEFGRMPDQYSVTGNAIPGSGNLIEVTLPVPSSMLFSPTVFVRLVVRYHS